MKRLVLVLVLLGFMAGISLAGQSEYLRSNAWTPALADTFIADSVRLAAIIDSNSTFTSYAINWGYGGGYGNLWFKVSSVHGVVNIDLVKDYSEDMVHWIVPGDSLILAAYSTEAQNGKMIFFNTSISGETSTTIPYVRYVRFRFKNIPNGRGDTKLMARIGFSQ